MKKKFLIAIIPALLALSACQGGAQEKVDKNLFLEDTLAHEEIFGDINFSDLMPKASKLGQPGIRKLGSDPVEHPDLDPAIGVQSKVESAGYISFRFVAAVEFTKENIGPTNAQWTRTVSKKDGSSYPKDTGNIECTTAYTSLSSDGDPYTIDDFNEAQDPDSTYTHFVVYTLRNVPVDSNDYFVSAYLTLSGVGGLSLTSKAVAINASQTERYAYVHNLGAYFLEGTFADPSMDSLIPATTTRTIAEGDGDIATFDDLVFTEGDSFVVKEFYNTKLYIHSSDYLRGSTNPIRHYFEPVGNSIVSNFNGSYDLYINHESHLWANVDSVSNAERYLYVYLDNDWYLDGTFAAIYAFGNSGNHWYKLQSDQSYKTWLKTAAKVNTSLYHTIIVVRINDTANPDDLSWGDQAYGNQTGNLPLTYDTNDCAYVHQDGSGEMNLRVVS